MDATQNLVLKLGITRSSAMDLLCGIICVILRLAVLIQYWSVTDRQTHPHTQTNGQTHNDGI